uniref:(3R)-3-hydroxyacyl-CoA dehydrogenase n=1 Tax=Amblyomma maculatum TaxID=34609 RepID=G3MQ47_AMBMU
MALCGRLALVTGGASGIGEAVCRTLAADGATVVVADKQLEAARKVAGSLTGDSEHQALYVDVGDSSSVEQLFTSIRCNCALPLSIVVNCAGILRSCALVECTDEHFDEIIRVNLKGTFLVTRAACRDMCDAGKTLPDGGGAIVNIASILGKTGWPEGAAYTASKGGVIAFTKTVAQEMAAHGIRCNAVLPGMTDTPLSAPVPEEIKAGVRAMTPLKRSGKPYEIAEAIKFLCSPTASSFVTGAALEVTGGCFM